ncbi:hypothetical protein C2S53_014487 [Perilla frutescens var. hirtella]|uniref:Flavone synthase II n=1 Tax=Perilla frutescens var. hirtella TaxID=608512 RepID=A0AAD4IUW9_PERFH|nr:hypothetical protein C2S53_014487 [Perilla frutescens var. hirtella]
MTLILLVIVVSAAVVLLWAAVLRRKASSSPPGPLALPLIGHLHLLGPRLHHSFDELSKRYGPLMHIRLGSMPCAVVSSPQLAEEFLKTNDAVFSTRKGSTVVDMVTYRASFAFGSCTPYWKFIKKLCTYELLGSRNINHFRPIRTLEVRNFLQILMRKGTSGESFDVSEELLKMTNNVISNMMLSIGCTETETEAEGVRRVVREVTQIFGELDVADVIRFCNNFDFTGIRKRSRDIHSRYDAFLEKIITQREHRRRSPTQPAGEPADLLDMLLDIMESGKAEVKITRDHLKSLILDFFTAGTDTTATTSEWALSEMISNPRVLKKAQDEIDKVVGRERLLEESDAPNLPYLYALIKETFRLHPPIPLITRFSISDCVIDGYHIPADTMLFVNSWSIGRNPNYWDTPLQFRPERFLDGGPSASIDFKGKHYELLPFGTGRRGCPGMLLAIQELILIIGTMIQCFQWELPHGPDSPPLDMTERQGLAAPRAHPLVCRVVPRVEPALLFSG